MKKLIVVILVLVVAFGLFVSVRGLMIEKTTGNALAVGDTSLRNGDIIFQTSRSSQSRAIQLATHSKYSHMGIVYESKGQFFVYEAVQPVKLTILEDWIKRGEDGHYVVKRLRDSERLLTQENLQKMKKFGETFQGKDYDIYFGWSDEKIYCSELVWKVYKEVFNVEIGELQELREFDLTNEVVKVKLEERYGNALPLNEKVISPARMFDSDLLITVTSN